MYSYNSMFMHTAWKSFVTKNMTIKLHFRGLESYVSYFLFSCQKETSAIVTWICTLNTLSHVIGVYKWTQCSPLLSTPIKQKHVYSRGFDPLMTTSFALQSPSKQREGKNKECVCFNSSRSEFILNKMLLYACYASLGPVIKPRL